MEIRLAKQDDISSICAFDHLAWQDNRRQFIEDSVASGNASVAILEGQVVGYVVLEYSFFWDAFMTMLYIHGAHRREGIGTALIRHVESMCKTSKLFTSTGELNRPMQALMVKLGYSPSGVINNVDDEEAEIVYLKRGEKLYFDRDGDEDGT